MQRSTQDILKDASEVANRTNLQFLFLVGGLALVWLTGIETQYKNISSTMVAISRVQVGKENTTRIVGLLSRRGQELRTSIRARTSQYDRSCEADASTSGCSLLVGEIRGERARLNVTSRLISQAERLQLAQRSAIERLRRGLGERINFDFGYGLKLPFSFVSAPLIWLLLLWFILVRTLMQRGRFWSLIALAVQRLPEAAPKPVERYLVQMPLWLAPAPRGTQQPDSEPAFQQLLGWKPGWGSNIFVVLLFLGVAAIAIRVAWIGLVVSGTGAEHSIHEAGWVGWATAAAIVGVLWLLGSLALPWWTSTTSSRPQYQSRERRVILGGGAAAIVLFAIHARTSAAYAWRWNGLIGGARLGARRFKRRRPPVLTMAGPQLRPGWYRHVRSSAIHYVWPGNRVRYARGLVAANLRPLDVRLDPNVTAAPTAVPVWIASRDFPLVIESMAEQLARGRRADEAVGLLISATWHRLVVTGLKSVLPFMDRAARIATAQRLAPRLDQLIRLAEAQAVHTGGRRMAPLLEGRIRTWRRSLSRVGTNPRP